MRVTLSVTVPLVKARAWGRCEACGASRPLDAHHRQARGMGGVGKDEALEANDVRNLLALCRSCHDETEHEQTWQLTEQLGWRIPKWHPSPLLVPALLRTVQGRGWHLLDDKAGYVWLDVPVAEPFPPMSPTEWADRQAGFPPVPHCRWHVSEGRPLLSYERSPGSTTRRP